MIWRYLSFPWCMVTWNFLYHQPPAPFQVKPVIQGVPDLKNNSNFFPIDIKFVLFKIHFNLNGKMSEPTYVSTTKVLKKDYVEGETQWLRFPYPREKGTHFYDIRAFDQDGTLLTKRSNYAFLCLHCDKSKIEEYEKVIEEPTLKDKVIQKLIKYGLMAGFFVVLCGIGFTVYKCIKCEQSKARRQISYPIQTRNQNQDQDQDQNQHQNRDQNQQKEIKVDIPKIRFGNGSDSKDLEDSKDEEEHQPFVSVQYFRVVPKVSTSYRGGGCDFDFD